MGGADSIVVTSTRPRRASESGLNPTLRALQMWKMNIEPYPMLVEMAAPCIPYRGMRRRFSTKFIPAAVPVARIGYFRFPFPWEMARIGRATAKPSAPGNRRMRGVTAGMYSLPKYTGTATLESAASPRAITPVNRNV